MAKGAPDATKILGGEDLSEHFGLDITHCGGPATAAKPKRSPSGKKVRAQGNASLRRETVNCLPEIQQREE